MIVQPILNGMDSRNDYANLPKVGKRYANSVEKTKEEFILRGDKELDGDLSKSQFKFKELAKELQLNSS